MADLTAWRALVDKELAGAPFDKLVQRTAEGLAIEPLYVEAPANATRPITTGARAFRICMRARRGEAAQHIDGGADALWLDGDDLEGIELAAKRGVHVIVDQPPTPVRDVDRKTFRAPATCWMSIDPLSHPKLAAILDKYLAAMFAKPASPVSGDSRPMRVSTLAHHAAGADSADELAFALSTTVAYLRGMTTGPVDLNGAASQLWFQIAVGRDTFGELCKLRALRVLAAKLFAASSITAAIPPIHAVTSSRTQAARDPWVNLLRVTTEVFAAAIGGADLVTPLPFDTELAEPSALGRRVARNTALVLRDESYLGRVIDAAGGSYYIESRTDALAREAWQRFRAIERDGGIAKLVATGALQARLDASWKSRAAAIATRKEPVLGVSEFANLDEKLPSAPAATSHGHRDAEAFEALRAKLEGKPKDVVLVALGTPAESRARVGFAKAVFATAGVRAREGSIDDARDALVCLCGSDDNYAATAATVAAQLRAAGVTTIALAGKPSAIAGVDTYICAGGDVLAALEELLA
ncbi:MAG TPA: methylmalonyl-CoA mutase family protein [Kofleriaceae bacterium]|nr:methylmalonyl-CoA mutase family protein [Kofleriaceae bacterium]